MPADSADRGRNQCVPTEIYTDVVRAKARQEGSVIRRIRVFKDVEEIDFCAAEVLQARVEAKASSWFVSVLFKVVVGFDPGHHRRVVRTIAFYKTQVPYPRARHQTVDVRKLESKVKIDDLECYASAAEDGHVIVAELRFKLSVFGMEDDVITVCRLHGQDRE